MDKISKIALLFLTTMCVAKDCILPMLKNILEKSYININLTDQKVRKILC